MRVTLAVTACMLSVVSSVSYSADTLPDIENEGFIKECVRMHNKFRSGVTPTASDMLYMTWDPVLARIAKAWARNCQFAHNVRLKPPHKLHPNFTSLGENLWTGSLSIFSVSSAITDWSFGQIVTKLAVQYSFVLEFLALKVLAVERILYATMHQQEITQPGHIKKDPRAVPAPVMTTVWTISALTHNETK
ncbi:glioma pathogenesis-related protein 1 isoform X2 [Hippopotamus amphibius kiboko]|uniref:glioma pathogenesis-related protein 1 isoform X2 n=1 Tax=Hippopotamus amphibius kiboko TaxID=575201 RepID=UPI002595B3D3|nr:glioma pathogenesis-related protein 1 isoform X2 [Hippopotamus amphibius kiboko]